MSAALKVQQILSPPELIHALLSEGRLHVCQEQGLMFQQELMSAEAIDINYNTFFQKPATVMLWPKEIAQRDERRSLLTDLAIKSSSDKNQVLADVRTQLVKLTNSDSLVNDVILVADEFITNAVYNAPNVDPVTRKSVKVDRSTVVSFPPGKEGRLFLAADDQRVVVGIEDPFGSLDVQSYLSGILKCYEDGVRDAMNFGAGGAGIGAYLIFKTGSSLYIGVKPGQTTLLACVIPYRMSNRKREVLPKHLHWIKSK